MIDNATRCSAKSMLDTKIANSETRTATLKALRDSIQWERLEQADDYLLWQLICSLKD